MTRKSPYEHPVTGYTKGDGTSVTPYTRGNGLPSIKLANPALSLKLPTIEVPESTESFGEYESIEDKINTDREDEVNFGQVPEEEKSTVVTVNETWDGSKSIRINGLTENQVDMVRQAEKDFLDGKQGSEALMYYYQTIVPMVQEHVEPEVYQRVPQAKFWGSTTCDEVQIEVQKPDEGW